MFCWIQNRLCTSTAAASKTFICILFRKLMTRFQQKIIRRIELTPAVFSSLILFPNFFSYKIILGLHLFSKLCDNWYHILK